MKKITLLLSVFLFGAAIDSMGQTTARQALDAPFNYVEETAHYSSKAIHPPNVLAAGDTVLSENFSSGIPAGWTQQGANQFWKWIPPSYVNGGCFSAGTVRLASTT